MPKVPAKFRIGEELEGDSAIVQKQLDEAYTDIAPVLNGKPDMVITTVDPTANDEDHNMGSLWLNRTAPRMFVLRDLGPAVWKQIF